MASRPSLLGVAGGLAGGLTVGYALGVLGPAGPAQALRNAREQALSGAASALGAARGSHPSLDAVLERLERILRGLKEETGANGRANSAAPAPPVSGESSLGGGGGEGVGSGDLTPSCSLTAAGAGSGSGGLLPPAGSVSAASVAASSEAGGRGGSGGDKLRMVVIVRDDVVPRWGQGKTASMVATVLLGLYKRCYKSRELRPILMNWEAQKGAKSLLRVPGEAALSCIVDAARGAGVAAHTMLEVLPAAAAGEAPSRTRAILALGPATPAALNAVGCQGLPAL